MEEKNIEMNGIEYEVKSLIEFSSLAKLLFDLSKRQKDLEQNIILIKTSINDKDNRLSNLENKILGLPKKDKEKEKEKIITNIIKTPNIIMNAINKQLQKTEKNVDSSNKAIELNEENQQSIKFNEDENQNILKKQNENKANDLNKEKININNDDININAKNDNEDKKEIIKEKKEDKENKEKDDKMESISDIENISDNFYDITEDKGHIKLDLELISRLFKKINDLEKKINQINTKTKKNISPQIQSNSDNINNIQNQLGQCNENVVEVNNKLLLFKEEFDKIKVKVEDFNIYDIFKGDASSGGNVDVTNALIQALEKKVFKKFELYDEKNKKNEEDLFKAGENVKNMKGLIDNLKNLVQKNSDKIKEIENNFNDYKKVINKSLDEIKNNFLLLEDKLLKTEIKDNNSYSDNKIKEIEEKLNKLLEKPKEQVIITKDKEVDSQLIKKLETYDNIIKDLNKSINQLEKNLNKKINEENKIIKDKLSLIENDIKDKANARELLAINDKLYNLEEVVKVMNANLDSLQQYNEKFKSDINSIFKKLEYFDGEIFQIKDENDKNSLKKYTNIDSSNFLPQSIFNFFKKEANSKFEKIKVDLDNLNNSMETISSSLNHYPSNKEFSKFQKSLINLIDDFKSSIHKKYMERSEIQKSLKIIDNQIKFLNEAAKKYDTSETWLLAKKPIGNYQCASCESNLKDLEQKDNFVAWNRYPSREDKTYRMGHGYSRILEMVNEEVIKSFENKDNKGYNSDDDKSGNSKNNSKIKNKSKLNESTNLPEKKNIKLPKVNKKILNLNNNFTLANYLNSPYEITEPSNQDEPKVTKIYKVNNKRNLFFKTKTDNNTLNINEDNSNKNKDNKKNLDLIQMNLTMPNNN